MLGHADDQRFIDQAALFEVIEEGGKRLIETGAQFIAEASRLAFVRVPRAVGKAELIPVNADKSAARFDEPAGLQARLAEKTLAVTLTHGRRLALEIERLTQPQRRRDREGELPIPVQIDAGVRLIEVAPRRVELLEQAHARVEPVA